MKNTLTLRINLIGPPSGVDYGIQQGSGSVFTTIVKQRSTGHDLSFDFEIQFRFDDDGVPVFTGPIVQGPKDGRFVYIGIGTYAGQQESVWQRRLKIPLRDITKKMILQVQSDANLLLATTVPGVAKDEGPNCGTVKPFDGWKVSEK